MQLRVKELSAIFFFYFSIKYAPTLLERQSVRFGCLLNYLILGSLSHFVRSSPCTWGSVANAPEEGATSIFIVRVRRRGGEGEMKCSGYVGSSLV